VRFLVVFSAADKIEMKYTLAIAFMCVSSFVEPASANDVFANWPVQAEISIRHGVQRVVIPSGRGGLQGQGFPDMPIVVLKQRPVTFLMVCGNDTYLWSGKSLSEAMPVSRVLSPGPAGSMDNNYAGIASVCHDKQRKRLIAFYHAEDKEGIGKVAVNDVQGFYGRVCVAESPANKVQFSKLGPALTADQPKKPRGWETEGGPVQAWMSQGVGDPSVCIDADGEHLLCMYNEHSNRLKAGRGVQLCVARAPLSSAGLPGSWTKFYQGAFSEPGLGGHDTPVITAAPQGETITPHLQYVSQWQRYIVVFGVGIYSEINGNPPKVAECGIYLSSSENGTEWTKPVKAKTIFNIWVNGHESMMHPFLVIDRATKSEITGQLMYRYTPRWPDDQGHLVSLPVRISMNSIPPKAAVEPSGSDLLIRKLKGTKWVNSRNVSFEWKADGRFLHKGIEREWEALDGHKVKIVFGPEHVDTLIFNESVTEFKQLIRGGPDSFQGRRQP